MNQPKKSLGFTLMELIVSIAIVSMMLFLVNRIFFESTNAVSRGIATSKIISNNRTIIEQIKDDFTNDKAPVLGPDNPDYGILVIVNKKYTNVSAYDARVKGGIVTKDVRSDQLCFIRTRNTNQEPFAGNRTSYTNTSQAEKCRIWYGHLLQTDENGNYPTKQLGSSYTAGEVGRDKYATNWILGRQVLYFDNEVYTASPYQYADFGNSWNLNYGSNQYFYYGKTDILNTGYETAENNTPSSYNGSASVNQEIVRRLSSFSGFFAHTNYRNFIRDNYFVFTSNRLAVNPSPSIDNLSASELAQMHPFFVNNVSDFIVEFAGDYYNGNIAGSTDGKIDTDSENNIRWYGLDSNPGVPGGIFHVIGGSNQDPYLIRTFSASALYDDMYVFRHDDTSYWPYLLRIRYRLHDPKGELLGEDYTRLTDGKNNDGDGTTDEYISNHNDLSELGAEPGKMYEIIVKVPR